MELGRRSLKGDVEATNELIVANLRFVISDVKKYQGQGLSLSDLIAAGNEGMIRAGKKFDPGKGVKFISYAVWWIRQACVKALAEAAKNVKVPQKRMADIYRLRKQIDRNLAEAVESGTPITEEAAAQDALLQVDVPKDTYDLSKGFEFSLDAPEWDDSPDKLYDRLRFGEEQENVPRTDKESLLTNRKEKIAEALGTLPSRDKKILKLYFGLDDGKEHTLEEIGEMLGVTRERIRQLRDRALKKLKEPSAGNGLRELVQ